MTSTERGRPAAGKNLDRHKFAAQRRYVPKELCRAKVCNIDVGALACAYLVKRRLSESRGLRVTVFIDLDGQCYAAQRWGPSMVELAAAHPEIIVGVYDAKVDPADLAADLEDFRRAA